METPWFVSLLVSWLPFLALIGVWIYLTRGTQKRGLWALTADHLESQLAEMRRMNAALERIAAAVEKRPEK